MTYLIKISASGNRFLIADQRWFDNAPEDFLSEAAVPTDKFFKDFLDLGSKEQNQRAEFLRDLFSSDNTNLTDGLIVLRDYNAKIPKYDFYNRDGSKPEMCGNAACSLLLYAEKTKIPFQSFYLAQEKITSVKNEKGDYSISLTQTPQIKGQFQFKDYSYNLVESGVPHAVLEWKQEFKSENFKKIAQELRFKNPLNDQGMNVSFYQVIKDNYLQAVTFERGVEDFTLACGTGALSIAFHFANKHKDKNFKEVCIKMPGGLLTVQIDPVACLHSPAKWGY